MLGFIIGTFCLIGLIRTLKAGRHGGWGHGWGHHGYGCHPGDSAGRGRRRWRSKRAWLRYMFERLDTMPGQEKAILAIADQVGAMLREARSDWEKAREDMARALRAETLDQAALSDASTRLDEASQRLRETISSALGQLHELLDQRQREELADMLTAARSPLDREHGPYRSWA